MKYLLNDWIQFRQIIRIRILHSFAGPDRLRGYNLHKDDEQDDALEPEELCEGVDGQVGDEKEALDGEHGLVAGQGQLHPLCKIPCQNSALNKETVARIKTHTQKDDLDYITDILFTCTLKGLKYCTYCSCF